MTDIVKVDASLALEPTDMRSAYEVAKLIFAGRVAVPSSVKSPEAVLTIMMTGRELGMTAMQSLRSIHIIEGKPVLSADLMVALCSKSALCEYFRLVSSDDKTAVYEAKRSSQPEPVRLTYTFEQAKQAGLTNKDNYRKHPAAMLRARCSAALARVVFPDLLMGFYAPEEMVDVIKGEPIEVVPTPPPSSPRPIGEGFEAIKARIMAGEREGIGAAVKAASLSDAERDELRALYRQTQQVA
jgi:hypothetical protein